MAKQEKASRTGTSVETRESPGRWRSATGLSRSGFTSPFGIMHELSDEMSRFFGNFGFGREPMGFGDEASPWVPAVDVLRRGEEFVVRADLPGMSRDDITLDVSDNVLTIQGERREEKEEEREGYYWHERSAGSFTRRIPLPEGANADKANARFDNGVLEVSLPAPKREEPSGKRIEIR